MNIFDLNNYDYNLPNELIAQNPHFPADECKLLFSDKGKIIDKQFKNILEIIPDNSVIFLNDTKVIRSRLILGDNTTIISANGETKKIGKGEIFFLKTIDEGSNIKKFEALVYPGKKIKPGTTLRYQTLDCDYDFKIIENTDKGRIIQTEIKDIISFFENHGEMPLPPYVNFEKEKESSYQSIFADKLGSVASPTACLHFTKKLISDLKLKGVNFENVTLHIGLGTFKTIDTNDIREYSIHGEKIIVDIELFKKIYQIKSLGKNIIAVGTTATRNLETLPYIWAGYKNHIIKTGIINDDTKIFWDNLTKEITNNDTKKFISDIKINNKSNSIFVDTKLFIFKGFKFKIIDELITNFHLPKSSLLVLVAALMGYDEMIKCYQHAINNKYKFFSFGDAMYIRK